MKKEYVAIIKKAIKELGDKEWKVDNDGKIWWKYVSETKPAFEMFVGKEHDDGDGTYTRVFATDLTMNEVFKYTYAGTDKWLCTSKTVEEAIYAVAQSVVKTAKSLY